MILYEQKLIDTLRNRCDKAKKRIWIASPYIGHLKDIRKIIGGRWMLPSVDCRILTDAEAGFIRKDTFDEFTNYQVEIRSLYSLHAKIYIVDDWCLVTSANLTDSAFFCRFEMGVALDDVKDVEARFLNWWGKGDPVSQPPKKANRILVDYQDGKQFPRKYKASAYKSGAQDKYDAACEKYNDFAQLYKKLTGRNPKMVKAGFTLLQEVDYFFNYLYHDHPQIPSNGQTIPRSLSAIQRDKDILRYFKDMCLWYDNNPQEWRLDRTTKIRYLLAPNHIDRLTWVDVKEVIKCFHCLDSYPINKTKFSNPANNNLRDIRDNWKKLLHTGPVTQQKVNEVIKALKNFGPSSANELVGWYYPNKYPIMNTNSNCGMRFFGYRV